MNRKKAQGRFVFCCIAPAAILVTLFIFIPTFNVFRMSLYRMGGITNKKEFVGFNNFKSLIGDENFLQAMQNTIAIIVLVTLFTIFFAILFGAILHRGKFKGKNFFRVIFYVPNILSIVVIAGIFGAIYNPSTGLLNTFLRAIGLDALAHQWMGDQKIVLYSIIFALVWQAIGYCYVYGQYGGDPGGSLRGGFPGRSHRTPDVLPGNASADLEQYPDHPYFLHHQYDQLKLPVRSDHVRRRPQRPLGSIPELYVQAGIWRRRIWLWYGHWRSGISFLVCTCSSCQ